MSSTDDMYEQKLTVSLPRFVKAQILGAVFIALLCLANLALYPLTGENQFPLSEIFFVASHFIIVVLFGFVHAFASRKRKIDTYAVLTLAFGLELLLAFVEVIGVAPAGVFIPESVNFDGYLMIFASVYSLTGINLITYRNAVTKLVVLLMEYAFFFLGFMTAVMALLLTSSVVDSIDVVAALACVALAIRISLVNLNYSIK